MTVPSPRAPFVSYPVLSAAQLALLPPSQFPDVHGDREVHVTRDVLEVPGTQDFLEAQGLLGIPQHLRRRVNRLHLRDLMYRGYLGDLVSRGDPQDLEAPGVLEDLGLSSHLQRAKKN